MTRFRMPPGWVNHMKNEERDIFKRPPLRGWLAPNRNMLGQTHSVKRSYQYWSQIHWATPPWMTKEMWLAVKEIYESATPGIHEIDHIVPLKHKLVCGLNVPWNLKREDKRVNQLKSNNHWPNCPDHLDPVKNLPEDMFGFEDLQLDFPI